VARKKSTAAFFEVIQRTAEKQPVAGTGAAGVVPGQKPQPPAPAEQSDSLEKMLPRPAGIANGPFAAPKKPTVWREEGRTNISLGRVGVCVAAVGVLALLALLFLLGRWTAPSDNVAEAVSRWPGPDRPRKADRKYLRIEKMGGGLAPDGTIQDASLYGQAEGICGWCTAKGYPATVASWNGQIIVWSEVGFPAADERAMRYAREVEKLGKEYGRSTGSKWNFSQRDREGKFEPLFLSGGQ